MTCHDLDSMILVGYIQLSIFCDCMILQPSSKNMLCVQMYIHVLFLYVNIIKVLSQWTVQENIKKEVVLLAMCCILLHLPLEGKVHCHEFFCSFKIRCKYTIDNGQDVRVSRLDNFHLHFHFKITVYKHLLRFFFLFKQNKTNKKIKQQQHNRMITFCYLYWGR